ncbi:MAG: hypothetical protein CL488_01690 [Acidobacteria bacterium]|nr:hypothetical protein [Acidobacteriota bacterium]
MRTVVSGIRCSLFLVLLTLLVFSNSSDAQMTASLLGSVVDVQGKPLSGVTLKLQYHGNVTREIEVSTDDAGKFARLGLQQGPYELTAQKDGFDVETLGFSLNVGRRALLTLTLLPEGARRMAELAPPVEDQRESAVRAALQAGAAASVAGDHQKAITLFILAVQTLPECHECHYRLGRTYAQLEDYTKAEVALERVLEIDPEYAPAYRTLAVVYSAQERFDEAAAVRARAAKLTSVS